MASQRTVVITLAVLLSLLIFYSLVNLFITSIHGEEEKTLGSNYDKILLSELEKYSNLNDYWNGLPISTGNFLYIKPTVMISEDYKNFQTAILKEHGNIFDLNLFNIIYDTYAPKIGINGIIDIMSSMTYNGSDFSQLELMQLGKFVYSKLSSYEDLHFGIEVFSRSLLDDIPLSGFIWEALSAFAVSKFPNPLTESDLWSNDDIISIFHFINTRFCYFKTEESFAALYKSCVKSVGHTLGFLLSENVEKAIAVCSLGEDLEFNYECAEGVFLTISESYPRSSYAPCDRNDFPSACFRFIPSTFTLLNQSGIEYPCNPIPNRYHKIGCVWGETFSVQLPAAHAYEYCEKYKAPYVEGFLDANLQSSAGDEKFAYRLYIACVDGFFTSRNLDKADNEKVLEKACSKFEGDDYAKSYCENFSLRENLQKHATGEKYNFLLLELDYDPKTILTAVTFPEIKKGT